MTPSQTSPPGPPPGAALYPLAVGHYVSHALRVAVQLALAEALHGGPREVADLAASTSSDADALRRLLRLLASVGVFAERADGRFEQTPVSDTLRADAPGSMRAAVLLFAGRGIIGSWQDLEYCVRTGQPAFKRTNPDGDPFDAIESDPEQAAIFDEAMAAFAPQVAAAVLAGYDFAPFETVVDVGGGNGALLVAILRAHPKLRGIVFDRPDVARKAQAALLDGDLGERCRAIGGDFFREVPVGGDAYLLKHVIHDWNDDDAVAILKRCREVVPASGRVLILEGVYPERIEAGPQYAAAAQNDVNMLVNTGGRQRSAAEFEALFTRADLKLRRIVSTPGPLSVLEGEPA